MSNKVRVGQLVKLENSDKKKFSNENPFYFGVIIKYEVDGKTKKRTLLFTEKELDRAADRAEKNVEGRMEQSIISKIVD